MSDSRFEFHEGDRVKITGRQGGDVTVCVIGEPVVDEKTGTTTLLVAECAHPDAVVACNLWQCPDCGQRASILDNGVIP